MAKPPARNRTNRGASQLEWGASLQDRRPLDTKIAEVAAGVVDEALEAPLEDIADIQELLATGVFVGTAELELQAGSRGGTVMLDGVFASNQVGAPVVMTQGPNGDEDEFGIVQFTAAVLSTSTLQVRWCSYAPAPARVRVNYVIGLRA